MSLCRPIISAKLFIQSQSSSFEPFYARPMPAYWCIQRNRPRDTTVYRCVHLPYRGPTVNVVAVATNELQEGVSSKMMIHPAYRKTAVNHVPAIATRIHTVNRRTEPILLLTFIVVFCYIYLRLYLCYHTRSTHAFLVELCIHLTK